MADEQNVPDKEFSLRDSNILYPYVRDQGHMNVCYTYTSTEATAALYARETSEPPIELSTQQLVDHVPIVYKYEEKGSNRDKVGCYFDTHLDCLKYAMHTAMCLERDYPKRASRWKKDIIDPILNKKEKYVIGNYEQLNAGDEEKVNDTLKYQSMHNVSISLEEEEEEEGYSSDEDIVTFAGGRKMSRKHRKEYTRERCPVVPLRSDYYKPICTELSRMAMDKFNNENAQNDEFVEILNMNGQKGGGIWYYITFNAKDADFAKDSEDAVKTFQTLGWEGISADLDVSVCRLKKSSSHEGDTKSPDSDVGTQ